MGPDAIKFIWDGKDVNLSVRLAPNDAALFARPMAKCAGAGIPNRSGAIEFAESCARRGGLEA